MRGNGPAVLRALWIALILPVAVHLAAAGAQANPVGIALGRAMATLNGPWLFRVGDDPRWAQPDFDDMSWERVDLTPTPGATDGDVGLPGYVPGWTAKGHPGYHGFAWYRIHLNVEPPAGESLAVLGPWAVDSAYQVYANGTLVGGVGGFADPIPTAYGDHYPRMFLLRPRVAGGPIVIAIRVWMGAWGANEPGAGGIHIAPAIGGRNAIAAQYRLEQLKIFEGYAVDAVPSLLFFLAAAAALCLIPFDPGDRAYPWLAIALTLSGIQRGNQAFFFWWQIETVQNFVIFIVALTGSLAFAAWMMAWRSWFKLDRPKWLVWAIAGVTPALMLAQLLARPWLFDAAFPHAVLAGLGYLISGLRLAFLLMLALIAFFGTRRHGREAWLGLPAVLALVAVLFTAELVKIGVPGIWFPWGVGLSLSECASVVLVAMLAFLLLRRLWSHAPRAAAVSSVA